MVSHGYRWIDYAAVAEDVEREHIRRAVDILTKLTGARPVGWMTGRPGPNTRRLLVEAGGFFYDRDSLADELPYWLNISGRPHLVIPYSYEANDNRFNENSGFSTGDDFFTYMRDAFDVLYREGERGSPKLLSIGLHDRLIGRPGRCKGLIKLLEYMRGFDDVWFCTGAEIAAHWRKTFSGGERCRGEALMRPTVLREVDRVAVRIVNPVFGLPVRRPLFGIRRSAPLLADRDQVRDALHLEAEMIDSFFQLITFDFALRADRDDRQIDVAVGQIRCRSNSLDDL